MKSGASFIAAAALLSSAIAAPGLQRRGNSNTPVVTVNGNGEHNFESIFKQRQTELTFLQRFGREALAFISVASTTSQVR